MNVLQAMVLGLIQGLTEFLPVSSSGHLVLIQNIMGVDSGSGYYLFFDTMLHLGTLAAVIYVLRKDIMNILRHPLGMLMRLLVVATVPSVIIALLFSDFLEHTFGGSYLGGAFIITGLLLVFAEMFSRPNRKFSAATYKDALFMGVAQGIALLPGVSRSGATISGGLLSGLNRDVAARFSFLMSIPAIIGSVVFQAKDILDTGIGSVHWTPIIIGTLVAAISGLFAIKFMLGFVKKHKLYGFAVYVFILGALVVLDQTVSHFIF